MKKFLTFILVCTSLFVSCNDDLLERVEALEKATAVSLTSSISYLESQYLNLQIQIAALNMKVNSGEAQALEVALAQVEAELEELRLMMEALKKELSSEDDSQGSSDLETDIEEAPADPDEESSEDNQYLEEQIQSLEERIEAFNAQVESLSEELAALQTAVEELEKKLADSENSSADSSEGSTVAKMYNPPVDFHKADLKVLDIGNSYTRDAQTYLPQIVQAAGIGKDFSLYMAYRGSGSYKSWVDCWNDRDTEPYSISFCTGTQIQGVSGEGYAANGSLFRKALESVKWDIILIHQVSTYSNDYSLWEGDGPGGYLTELIHIIRKTNPQATIGYLMTHSYRGTYWANTEKSSLKRWENIVEATKQLKAEYGIDFIIPYGTAVQNLRASSLNDAYEFSDDGTHLGAGLGDYVAGCCYYQSLLAPRYGVSILGNSFRITNLDESVKGRKNVTDKTAHVAQKAAMLATYNMWTLSNPDNYNM